MGKDGVYFFKKDRKCKKDRKGNARYVSYTDFGKVIIARECPGEGFYSLVNVEERPKCIITDVKKEIYDYYSGISYEEFKNLLKKRGYKLAFEMPLTYSYGDKIISNEIRLVAYNPRLNMIVIVDTVNNKKGLVIACYCYGVSGNKFYSNPMFVSGSHNYAEFKLSAPTLKGYKPLHIVESYCRGGVIDKISGVGMPIGFTYADSLRTEEDFVGYRKDFLNRCPDKLRNWFVKG